MRTLIGWSTIALGLVACGMSLGALYHGVPRVEATMLGVLGIVVSFVGGHTVARERRRAARALAERERDRESRRRGGRRGLAGTVFLVLLLAAAAAAGYLVYGFIR